MENKDKNKLEELLKQRMKEDFEELENPPASTQKFLRSRIKREEPGSEKSESFSLATFFNFRLKLYQALMLCLVVGAMTFYFGGQGSGGEIISHEGNNPDSVMLVNNHSSSVKDNMFLVKRFAVSVN